MVSYRFATAADVREFYNGVPFTMRAVAVFVDGVCLAMICLLRHRGKAWMCAEYKPGFEPFMKRFAILRAVKLAMSMAKGPVYALADNKPLLKRLGFVPYEGDVYQLRAA